MTGSISALDFLVFAAYYIILKFLLTLVVVRWPESSVAHALAVLA